MASKKVFVRAKVSVYTKTGGRIPAGRTGYISQNEYEQISDLVVKERNKKDPDVAGKSVSAPANKKVSSKATK